MITGISTSPRNISFETAKTLIEKTPIFTKTVLVIAPNSLKEALDVCDYLKPDAVQIHGENIDTRQFSLSMKNIDIIKPVSVNVSDIKSTALRAADLFDAVLLDSSTRSKLGGTGLIHDWKVSKQITEAIKPKPLILAGGLKPDNVAEAIRKVRPYGVDVCTGTEASPGVKDPKKLQRFLFEVNEADRRLNVA
jgi:phosphoribosylanthranilate isomerase